MPAIGARTLRHRGGGAGLCRGADGGHGSRGEWPGPFGPCCRGQFRAPGRERRRGSRAGAGAWRAA
eukprot:7549324-Lingulodinium_polyedra.AAC.1